MKYLKTYELFSVGQGNIIDYEVNDIVVCTETKTNKKTGSIILENGKKYKILKIYQNVEDKFLKNPFLRVNVEDIETGEITKGWSSKLFKTDLEFTADKYNL